MAAIASIFIYFLFFALAGQLIKLHRLVKNTSAGLFDGSSLFEGCKSAIC